MKDESKQNEWWNKRLPICARLQYNRWCLMAQNVIVSNWLHFCYFWNQLFQSSGELVHQMIEIYSTCGVCRTKILIIGQYFQRVIQASDKSQQNSGKSLIFSTLYWAKNNSKLLFFAIFLALVAFSR